MVVPSVEGWTFVTLMRPEATYTRDKLVLSSVFAHQTPVLLPRPEDVNTSAGFWSTRQPSRGAELGDLRPRPLCCSVCPGLVSSQGGED